MTNNLVLPANTQASLNRLYNEMQEASYPPIMTDRLRGRMKEFQNAGIGGIDRFVSKLRKALGAGQHATTIFEGYQKYLDIMIEGRFALILARNGFTGVEMIREDNRNRMPDLRAGYSGYTVFFEVRRINPEVDEWASDETGASMASPIDPITLKMKIEDKIEQLQPGESNVVVVWSDTVSADTSEVALALEKIQMEIDTCPSKYGKMSGVLFTSGGYVYPTAKQFYLFSNDKASKPLPPQLAERLDSLSEESREKILEDFKGLELAMRKLLGKDLG